MTDYDARDTPTHQAGPRFGTAFLVVLVVTAVPLALTTPAAAQRSTELPAEPAFVLELEPDGTARATVTVVFDLATDADRRAFEALEANATARDHHIERFAARMRTIATRAESTTGRDMAIEDPAIEFIERDDTGIVALSVTWTNLADRSGDALVLGAPFDNGFTPDRPVHVYGPDGYTIETASPAPTDQGAGHATWAADTAMEGFTITFEPADTPSDSTTADTPGFTFGLALIVLLFTAAGAIARQRRQ